MHSHSFPVDGKIQGQAVSKIHIILVMCLFFTFPKRWPLLGIIETIFIGHKNESFLVNVDVLHEIAKHLISLDKVLSPHNQKKLVLIGE